MMQVHDAQEKIVMEVTKWPGVIASPHRFGGTEFRLGRRELGHIHGDHQADIPFPMAVRNQLIADGRVECHHILAKSGLGHLSLPPAERCARGGEIVQAIVRPRKRETEIVRSARGHANEIE